MTFLSFSFFCLIVIFVGKTLQTISFLAWLRQYRGIVGPYLIVCPLNVLDTWCGEVKRWCPTFRVVRFHGSEKVRNEIMSEQMIFGQFDVVVTTYETLVVAASSLKHRWIWSYVIVDEAQRCKNENSLLAVALRGLPHVGRLLLTGTPLQNNMHELWSLLNFLYPVHFEESTPFDKVFDLQVNAVDRDMLWKGEYDIFHTNTHKLTCH